MRSVGLAQRDVRRVPPSGAVDPGRHDEAARPHAAGVHRAAAVLEDLNRRGDDIPHVHRMAQRDGRALGGGRSLDDWCVGIVAQAPREVDAMARAAMAKGLFIDPENALRAHRFLNRSAPVRSYHRTA